MSSRALRLLVDATLRALAILVGLVGAAIVTFNLHILVGLEEGYAASPAEVWDFSPVLVAVDLALLVAGPVLGLLVLARIRPRGGPTA